MKEIDSEMFSVTSQATINDDTDTQKYGLLTRFTAGDFSENEVWAIVPFHWTNTTNIAYVTNAIEKFRLYIPAGSRIAMEKHVKKSKKNK